jgi:hypothetical protein
MQTRLLSMEEFCKAIKKSAPYARALADSGAIDSYIAGSGWRAFPRASIEQARAHEKKKVSQVVEA